MNDFAPLEEKLREIQDLASAVAVLDWDQSTHMPDGGAAARGRQLATLARLAHERHIDPSLGALIGRLEPTARQRPYGSREAALVRIARREHDQRKRLPADFVTAAREHHAASYNAWTKARPAADFETMRPLLERSVELSRRYSDYFSGWEHPADPHIDRADRGMTTASIRALFSELRAVLVPMVKRLADAPQPDASFLRRHYPRDAQLALGKSLIATMGYDFGRGRQDLTHHPFMTRFSGGDVRITTRVDEHDLGNALFSTIHECGHALYEQNIDPRLDGTPLGHGVSAGVHEAQSRLWENLVGRSRAFWTWALPIAREHFGEQLADVDVDTFYRGINRVERTLVRVDADEVTYNLHVMIRFDLALELLEGTLSVGDLPEAWNARYEADLGVRPPDARLGLLQDVHWYCEHVGGLFQGYTLGNVMSAQFFAAARRAHPDIPAQIAEGNFAPLREWLRDNVYQHGSTFTPEELVERATGQPLTIDAFRDYLCDKYGALYPE